MYDCKISCIVYFIMCIIYESLKSGIFVCINFVDFLESLLYLNRDLYVSNH